MTRRIIRSFLAITLAFITMYACERQAPNAYTRKQMTHSQKKVALKEKIKKTSETVQGISSKVRMKQENGVYKVPIKINGVPMEFIFDTGASDITISNVEAMFLLRQGKLEEDDVLGEQYYQIADGSLAVGTVINLKEVQIANKKLYNVQASVVDNIEAPLLLGQSALNRFGKISIDYHNLIIEFQ